MFKERKALSKREEERGGERRKHAKMKRQKETEREKEKNKNSCVSFT